MAGSTEETLTQKETEIAGLKAELEKQAGRVENAQKKIHEWEAEVGETRKEQVENAKVMKQLALELSEANKAVNKAQSELTQAREELAALKGSKGPKGTQGNSDGQAGQSAAEIEKTLTADEQKALDAAWERATPEDRARIKGDEELRARFLLQARTVAAAERKSDLSNWRSTPAKASPSGEDDGIARLFQAKKKEAARQPDGPSGGTPRAGKRVINDDTPKPKASWL